MGNHWRQWSENLMTDRLWQIANELEITAKNKFYQKKADILVDHGQWILKKKKNKPHADWTYLLMKVRKSAENEHVSERTNERTNVKKISLKLLCEKEQRNKWK